MRHYWLGKLRGGWQPPLFGFCKPIPTFILRTRVHRMYKSRCTRIGEVKAANFIGLVVLGFVACNSTPKRTRYIFDSGTTGWVKITYDSPDAPQLPVEDGFTVVRIRQYLKVSTSSPMNSSWEGSEFYYQGPDGKRVRLSSKKDDKQRRLWALEKTAAADTDQETFFVGKPEQFTSHMSAGPDELRTGQGDAEPIDLNKAFEEPPKVSATPPK
jgi:hypothetical protein